MDSKKIVVIGSGNTNNICVLHDVVDSQFTDLREPEPFLITRLPEFKEPWIDPKEPIPNYKKHEQTCIKNRKKRKKRKRR